MRWEAISVHAASMFISKFDRDRRELGSMDKQHQAASKRPGQRAQWNKKKKKIRTKQKPAARRAGEKQHRQKKRAQAPSNPESKGKTADLPSLRLIIGSRHKGRWRWTRTVGSILPLTECYLLCANSSLNYFFLVCFTPQYVVQYILHSPVSEGVWRLVYLSSLTTD